MIGPESFRATRARGLSRKAGTLLGTLLATTALGVTAARAQNATWQSTSGDWNDPANWSPNSVPTGTATFSSLGTTAVNNASGNVTVGGITFTDVPNAQAYTITIDNNFILNGAGILNNSTSTQTFLINSGHALQFDGGTASGGTGTGAVDLNNLGGTINFEGPASAGSAIITTGLVQFFNTSSAGAAHITNSVAGQIDFLDNATAGTATITNNSVIAF